MILETIGSRFQDLVSIPAEQPGLSPALAWRSLLQHASEPVTDLGDPADDRVSIETGELDFPPYGAVEADIPDAPSTALYVSLSRHVAPASSEMRHLTINLFFAPDSLDMGELRDLGFRTRGYADEIVGWGQTVMDSPLGEPLSRESCLLGYWDFGWI